MHFDHTPKYDFDDVLIKPKRSTLNSRSEVSLNRSFTFRYSNKNLVCIPIIAANMDTVGTMEMAEALSKKGSCTALHKFYGEEILRKFYTSEPGNQEKQNTIGKSFLSFGMRTGEYDRVIKLQQSIDNCLNFCIDVPSAYIEKFVDFLRQVREDFPNNLIMSGNVVTAEMAEALILAGADIVKVGIGPGALCTTRRVAGVGVPQLSAIIECADAAHGLGGHICADGGIVHPGDLGKAFGAGADFVMLGSVLAGHKESCVPDNNGDVTVYGMSSDTAQEKYYGGVHSHRSSEGRTVSIPFKGKVENTLQHYLGGLRSTMTYIGAKSIKEIPKRTSFIVTNRQLNKSLED